MLADCTSGSARTRSARSRAKAGPVVLVYPASDRSSEASSTPRGSNPGFIEPAAWSARTKRPATTTRRMLTATCAMTKTCRRRSRAGACASSFSAETTSAFDA